MIEFYNLASKLEYADVVVDWLYDEWGDKGYKNRNFWDSWVRSSLSKDDIPQTYIVFQNSELVGTFSLWRCDLQSRQDLYPWLGGIYVKKTMRGKGIGLKIQHYAVQTLKKLGYRKAYLFTDMNGYYEKTGWNYLMDIPDEKGKSVHLYEYVIHD